MGFPHRRRLPPASLRPPPRLPPRSSSPSPPPLLASDRSGEVEKVGSSGGTAGARAAPRETGRPSSDCPAAWVPEAGGLIRSIRREWRPRDGSRVLGPGHARAMVVALRGVGAPAAAAAAAPPGRMGARQHGREISETNWMSS